MSGEKNSRVRIDRTKLRAAQEKQRQDIAQLRSRKKEERVRKMLDRIEQRNRAIRDAEERVLAVERETLELANREAGDLAQLAAEYRGRFVGFVPPTPPAGSLVDPNDLEAMRQAIEATRKCNAEYTAALHQALVEFHGRQMAGTVPGEMAFFARRFERGGVRTANALILGLQSQDMLTRNAQQDAQIAALRGRAAEELQRLVKAGVEPSQPTLDAAEAVTESTSQGDASEAFKQLELAIGREIAAQEAKEHVRRQAEAEVDRLMVSEQVMNVLEGMGYEISGIEETAFAERGELYAIRSDHPDHAMRFRLRADSEGLELIATPLRVVATGAAAGLGQRSPEERKEDVEYDELWCSRDIGVFREQTGARGLSLKFRREREPGDQTLATVTSEALGDDLARQRAGMLSAKLEQGAAEKRSQSLPRES